MSLLTPDSFQHDWYGWLTNQIGHIGFGIFLSFWMCFSYWMLMDELPYRSHVLVVIFIGYVVFEILVQGWRDFDTIEDTVFTVGYGASSVLFASIEIDPQNAVISISLISLVPFFTVSGLHLFFGSCFRRR